jgi:basic membrane lipoprotein Med (substrate-binding protein (PBP1-ABC) superfamily)
MALAVTLAAGCARHAPVTPPRFSARLVTSATLSGRWECAAERGLGRISSELDAEVARVRAADEAESRARLGELGAAGTDVVFCVGSGLERAVYSEAPVYPGTMFILLPGRAQQANVAGIEFLSEGVGYVAGAVATAVAPGPRAGVIRGSGGPWLEAIEEGFAAGFRSRGRSAVVETGAGVDGVGVLADAGVRLALYATDGAEPAVLEAAARSGMRLVATDPELMASSPQLVVAAIDLDVAEAMVRVAREVRDGTFTGRVFSFDLGSGVLDVQIGDSLDPETRAAAREAMETARAEVTAGLVEIDKLGL